jgi:hypothetical protein
MGILRKDPKWVLCTYSIFPSPVFVNCLSGAQRRKPAGVEMHRGMWYHCDRNSGKIPAGALPEFFLKRKEKNTI